MRDQLWTVTHATAEGQLRWWTVDEMMALGLGEVLQTVAENPPVGAMPLYMDTTTGCVMVWLTPGQSLTVERAR